MTKRALIADDDPIVRHILGAILKNAGFEVELAENGARCIATLDSSAPFDVIFLDMMLGDMTGMDVLGKIRPGVSAPVVMISAHQRDEALKMVGETKPSAFLEKPFVAQTVEEALMDAGVG